tara:strand:- start:272 stop:1003 length:732 start_codon:yes stop_codon:yes gene_type:complete
MYRLVLLALVISISGCGSTPSAIYQLSKREVAKNRPAYKQFQELCASPDRSQIYKTVNVDGYLFAATSGARCKGGWDVLAKQGYKYYECSSIKVKDRSSIKFDGEIYRLETGEEGDGRCVSWDVVEDDLSYHDKVEEFQTAIEGKCFIKSEVTEPKSRYVTLLEFGRVDNNGNHILEFPNDSNQKDLISFYGGHVIDLESGESLSIDRYYKYWPEGIKNKAVGKFECNREKPINDSRALTPKP